MPRISPPDEVRFWSKVDKKSPCWIWKAGRFGYGYGCFSLNGKLIKAHRYSWEFHYGKIPKNLCVLHKCDNPPCVKPTHLFLGTIKDNVQDSIQKGKRRPQYGTYNPQSKLTDKQVAEIKKMKDLWIPWGNDLPTKISKSFNVSPATIRSIWHGKVWDYI